ncbi:unnamed protein product (macronuclear) [Paramecium tetraurelia]|uniref:Transmembrane protein n=1 Tax=Paramecium tetraurelia TaxID=5888 RepID=A0C1W5_PARTE|nr:uncharacterized protein GSPATT00034259001 [Paramecium tetraurelia]CAK64782.1 unnamed protein product [Paramecium tetraurelia]|eukprot:XP_001432179.1 hypothetical protein (macronuclear) [Paramecium tetraurelia strain d4-2]
MKLHLFLYSYDYLTKYLYQTPSKVKTEPIFYQNATSLANNQVASRKYKQWMHEQIKSRRKSRRLFPKMLLSLLNYPVFKSTAIGLRVAQTAVLHNSTIANNINITYLFQNRQRLIQVHKHCLFELIDQSSIQNFNPSQIFIINGILSDSCLIKSNAQFIFINYLHQNLSILLFSINYKLFILQGFQLYPKWNLILTQKIQQINFLQSINSFLLSCKIYAFFLLVQISQDDKVNLFVVYIQIGEMVLLNHINDCIYVFPSSHQRIALLLAAYKISSLVNSPSPSQINLFAHFL